MDFWEVVRERRKEIGLSQEVLVERLADVGIEVSRPTLSYRERGDSRNNFWNPDLLRAYAQALELTDVELLARLGISIPSDFSPDVAGRLHRVEAISDPALRAKILHAIDAILDVLE